MIQEQINLFCILIYDIHPQNANPLVIISSQNFQYFFKHKDIKNYYEFFTNNYLSELNN